MQPRKLQTGRAHGQGKRLLGVTRLDRETEFRVFLPGLNVAVGVRLYARRETQPDGYAFLPRACQLVEQRQFCEIVYHDPPYACINRLDEFLCRFVIAVKVDPFRRESGTQCDE